MDEFAAIVMAELPHDQRERVKDRLRLLASTLDHSEWLGRIENWRRSDLIEANQRQRRYIDAQATSGTATRASPASITQWR